MGRASLYGKLNILEKANMFNDDLQPRQYTISTKWARKSRPRLWTKEQKLDRSDQADVNCFGIEAQWGIGALQSVGHIASCLGTLGLAHRCETGNKLGRPTRLNT